MSLLDVFNKPDREYRYGDGLLAPKPEEQRQGPGLLAGGAPQSSGQDIDPMYGLPKAIVEQYQRQDRMNQLFGGLTQLAGAFSRNPQHQQQAMQMGQQMATGTAPERLQQLSQMRNAYMQQQQQQQVMQSLPAIAQQTGISVEQLRALAASGKLGEVLKGASDPYTLSKGQSRFGPGGKQVATVGDYQALQQDGQLTGTFDQTTGQWRSPESVGAPAYTPPRQTANVAPGGSIVDTATGQSIYTAPAAQTDLERNVRAMGLDPATPEGQAAMRELGRRGTNVTTNVGGENQTINELGKGVGKRWTGYADNAASAASLNSSLDVLGELASSAPTGPITGRLAQMFPGFDSASAAFQSELSRMVPQFRVPGSGAQSDKDVDLILDGLPRLRNNPAANAVIIGSLRNKAGINMELGSIGDRVLNGEITREQGIQMERDLLGRSILTPELRQALRGVGAGGGGQQGGSQQAAPQPQARPQQPQSGAQEGATATNPQTGERIIFRNGRWEPAR